MRKHFDFPQDCIFERFLLTFALLVPPSQNFEELSKHYDVVSCRSSTSLKGCLLTDSTSVVCDVQYAIEWLGTGRSDRPKFTSYEVCTSLLSLS